MFHGHLVSQHLHPCFWTYTPALLRFSNVYFIDATTAETIQTDFRTIALAKEISEEDTRDWFARQKEEWLLLFNNADDTVVGNG